MFRFFCNLLRPRWTVTLGTGSSAPSSGEPLLFLNRVFDSRMSSCDSNQTVFPLLVFSLLLLVDFQIIRLVSEADLVFSPRGRTPVLWGLITRRDWPSTSPSKAQLLTSLPPPRPAPRQCSHFQHRLQGSTSRATHCPLAGHVGI